MSKLTELPVTTTADDADLVYVVDVSDTTDDPSGTSKAIAVSDLVSGGGLPAGTVVKEEIARITDPVGGEFDFDLTNYQDGDRIIIEGSIASDAAVPADQTRLYLNGDTTDANYYYQASEGESGEARAGTASAPYLFPAPGATAAAGVGAKGQVRVVLENYTGSDIQSALCTYNSYTGSVDQESYVGTRGINHKTATGAVTRVQIRPDGFPTHNIVGTLTCYIERTL